MTKAIVGIIGGSGVYNLEALTDLRQEAVASPWGEPSDRLRIGRIGATEAVFLARHGRGHRLSPSGINYRANIDALKRLGVRTSFRFPPAVRSGASIIPACSCWSTSSTTAPIGARRASSAMAASPTFRWPIRSRRACSDGSPTRRPSRASLPVWRNRILASKVRNSRRSPISLAFQARGADVIGMTGATEAKLAREAEISYATVAMITDFDCWHEEHGAVDVAAVVKVVHENAERAAALVARLARPARRARALPDRIRPRARQCHHDAFRCARSRAACQARCGRRTGLARVSRA